MAGCGPETTDTPQAAIAPVERAIAGVSWSDPYAYLENPVHEETVRYTTAERQYFEQHATALQPLQQRLVDELNGLLPVTRQTRPVRSGDFMVFEEVRPGTQYPVYQRYPVGVPDAVAVVLDVNRLAGGADYYQLGDFATLDEQNLVAYTFDRKGDQQYTLRVRIIDGSDLPFSVSGVGPDITWQRDRVVYSKNGCVYALAPRTGRQSELTCKTDPAFHLSLQRLGEHIAVISESYETTHAVIVPLEREPVSFAPEKPGHRYRLLFRDGIFFVLTNLEDQNFRLALAQPGQPPDEWVYLALPGEGLLVDVELLSGQIVLHRRHRLQDTIWLDTGEKIANTGPGESLQLRHSPGPGLVAYVRRSYLHPDRYHVYDTVTGETELVMHASTGRDIDASRYTVERRWYPSGKVTVPVTLVFRQGEAVSGRPLLLSGYGAYGVTRLASHDPSLFPLLDRGVVIGIVHPRGGGALGPAWHESGRGRNKQNTFADFIAATEGLIADGVGDRMRIAAMGTSAGGTLMGVIANKRPDLYRAIVARMPFVDLVTTLADESQVLTPGDRLEWGDPNNVAELMNLRAYSPYVQVRPQAYPSMLVIAAENDSRVPLYEPLKWMANLRANHSGEAQLLLNLVDEQGHLGATDQYERRQTKALEYAFILDAFSPAD